MSCEGKTQIKEKDKAGQLHPRATQNSESRLDHGQNWVSQAIKTSLIALSSSYVETFPNESLAALVILTKITRNVA